jgi:beta-lactamase class D
MPIHRRSVRSRVLMAALALSGLVLACGGRDEERGAVAVAAAARYSKEKLDAALAGTDSTFVLHDLARDVYVKHDPARATERFSPCSTFKIPNTLIALETGAARGPDHAIAWDAKQHPKQPFWDEVLEPRGLDWARDHTLTSAFHQSVVWYYQELAKQIGDQRMARYVDELEYGNRDTSGGIDQFWLSSSLTISADEQVAFLGKLATRRFELQPSTYDAAHAVFETESGPGYRLLAKTGSGDGPGGKGLGWYVGIVERGDERYVFAFNMTAPFETVLDRRVPLARAALRALGVLPPLPEAPTE